MKTFIGKSRKFALGMLEMIVFITGFVTVSEYLDSKVGSPFGLVILVVLWLLFSLQIWKTKNEKGNTEINWKIGKGNF